MRISSKSIREHIQSRALVSICRARIDQLSIQGFVLACSEALVLLQYVYDFHLDGFMLLRRKDITELKAGKTNRFQQQLLKTEGLLDQVGFDFRAPIESYDSFLAALSPDEMAIVEDEMAEPQQFLIGTVSHVDGDAATINHFTGVGRLVEPKETISLARITSCQIRTNYIQIYQRHFERVKKL